MAQTLSLGVVNEHTALPFFLNADGYLPLSILFVQESHKFGRETSLVLEVLCVSLVISRSVRVDEKK